MSTQNSSQAPGQRPEDVPFVLDGPLPRFVWTVRVPVPGNDDYRFAALPLLFQAFDQLELDQMQGRNLPAGALPPTDEEIVRRVVVGWPSLRTATGEAVPFSPEALERLMRAPVVRAATVATYLAAMSGMGARKNA